MVILKVEWSDYRVKGGSPYIQREGDNTIIFFGTNRLEVLRESM